MNPATVVCPATTEPFLLGLNPVMKAETIASWLSSCWAGTFNGRSLDVGQAQVGAHRFEAVNDLRGDDRSRSTVPT